MNLPVWGRCGHDVSSTMSHDAPHPKHKPVSLFSREVRICTHQPERIQKLAAADPRSPMPALINEVGGTLTSVTGLTNTYQPST